MNIFRILTAFLLAPLAALWATQTLPPTDSVTQEPPAFKLGSVTLKQIAFHDALTGKNDHFGCLLVDTEGRVVTQAQSKVWLYTGSQPPGSPGNEGWISHVCEFDLATLKGEPRRQILSVQSGDRWATVHLAVRVDDRTCLIFFSTGKLIRAAVGPSPQGPFAVDPDFQIAASEPWEGEGPLESDPGLVSISENNREYRFWKFYDMLGHTAGNAWAEVALDKETRRINLVRKHPANPMPLRLPGRLTARTGGTLDSSFRIDGKYLMLYLSKPDVKTYLMSAALSRDPLFQTIDYNVELDGPQGGELVIEKFQWIYWEGELYVFYDTGSKEGDWRTGLRRYRVLSSGKN
jgi:hypothetical protein